MHAKLTKHDINRLVEDPSPESRAETAVKVAEGFGDGSFAGEQRAMALQILEIMAQDTVARVRQAVAEHIAECPDISEAMARSLARDIDSVAAPILRYCERLTDSDLLEIIRASGEVKQLAIASRPNLSEPVSGSLVEHGSERVVTTVLKNPGARITERSFDKALDRFPSNHGIESAIARRGLLPMSIAERLVQVAADSLASQLGADTEMDPDSLCDLVMRIRERATLSLVDPKYGIGDARQLVATLVENDRLTPTIIVRALCTGDIAFFEAAMAHFAKLPSLNAQVLIHDEGWRGLQAIWSKAKLPQAMFPLVRAAVHVADELNYDGEPHDRERYQRRVMERILTRLDDSDTARAGLDAGSIDYLLGRLNQFSGEELAAKA